METSTDINSNEDLISRFFNKDSLIADVPQLNFKNYLINV